MSDRPHCRQVDACKSVGVGHCPSCAAFMRATPDYRVRMSEAKKRSFAEDPVKMTRAKEIGTRNLASGRAKTDFAAVRRATDAVMTPEERKRVHGRESGHGVGLIGEDKVRYRKLVRHGYGAARARARVDRERRAEHERVAAEMRARHEREKAQRYGWHKINIREMDV